MSTAVTGSGAKVSGYTEIRNGVCKDCHIPMDVVDGVYHCPTCGGSKGELLVAFSSAEIKNNADNEYQKERIRYCMRHRRDTIPPYLRAGDKLPLFKNKNRETQRLMELNVKESEQEVQNG